MSKNASCPPFTFTRDIPHKTTGLDCAAFHAQLQDAFAVAERLSSQYLKQPASPLPSDAHDDHQFVLAALLAQTKAALNVMQLIHKEYYETAQRELLCALAPVRQILETLYTTALLLRKRDMFAEYERAGWAAYYYRRVYQQMEEAQLPRCSRPNDSIRAELRRQLLGADGWPERPFSEAELDEIEKAAKAGHNSPYTHFPMPNRITEELNDHNPQDVILPLLKRLYVEYRWLCSYVHTGYSAIVHARAMQFRQYRNDLKEKEIVHPATALAFLTSLVLLTDVSSHLSVKEDLLVHLSNDWKCIENSSLLGMHIWDSWAKGALGLIST